LEIIQTQTDIAKSGLELDEVMALVCQRSQLLTGASGGVVELVEGDEMVYRAASGIAEPQLGLRLHKLGSLSGLCIKRGEILYCSDSNTDDRVDKAACIKVGLRSMIVVPLNYLDATVGVLKVLSIQEDAFSEADIQVLRLMSELIAAAMFHASKLESNALYQLATHDPLTGLANRTLFHDRLRQLLAQAKRHSYKAGILSLDMDDLKVINDKYGHRVGDAALKEVAARINNMSRESDVVARFGGDEFVIILSRIGNRYGAEQQIQRLSQEMNKPFQFENYKLNLRVSIGLAVFPDDAVRVDALLELADQAMYCVKRARKVAH
jgi:diguanylate cyclase (GGDEF)-like protein